MGSESGKKNQQNYLKNTIFFLLTSTVTIKKVIFKVHNKR